MICKAETAQPGGAFRAAVTELLRWKGKRKVLCVAHRGTSTVQGEMQKGGAYTTSAQEAQAGGP